MDSSLWMLQHAMDMATEFAGESYIYLLNMYYARHMNRQRHIRTSCCTNRYFVPENHSRYMAINDTQKAHWRMQWGIYSLLQVAWHYSPEAKRPWPGRLTVHHIGTMVGRQPMQLTSVVCKQYSHLWQTRAIVYLLGQDSFSPSASHPCLAHSI